MRFVFLLSFSLILTAASAAQAPFFGVAGTLGAGGDAKVSALTLPDGFFLADVAGGARFDFPVATVATPTGDLYVVEKAGVIRVIRDGAVLPQPFIDLREEVLQADDRGLLGLVLDPDFATNRYVYLSYVVAEDGRENTPSGQDSRTDAFARVTRYTATADGNRARLSTRRVLIGETWARGIPACYHSHSIGTLQFGRDGSLLVGSGDAAQYNNGVDSGGQYPDCFGQGPQGQERFPASEDIGAFRAQRLESLSGKILRIDPATGAGVSDNPFWTGNGYDNASRVWALGLRNPFRFTVGDGPGPGTIYAADVGFATWEELNVVGRGDNLGWPCFEGPNPLPEYQAATPPTNGCGTVGATAQPRYWWNHADPATSNPPGRVAFSTIAGPIYTGTRYPAQYQGRLFYGDYAMQWVATAAVGAGGVSGDQRFSADAGFVVHIGYDASTQWLTLTDVGTEPGAGRVWELRHVDGEQNSAPVAQAGSDVTQGTAPLAVTFSGSGSFDPDGDAFTHLWTFGDDAISAEADPTHVYTDAGTYTARLTVTDGAGASSSAAITITVRDGTAPTATIVSPTEGRVLTAADLESGTPLSLVGEATDPDQTPESLGYAWDVALLHNSHVHPDVFAAQGPTATYAVESHGADGDYYAIRIRLTVTDDEGLTDTAERIVPFESNDGGSLPPGWTSQTLGAPAIEGSAFLTETGEFHVRGSGDLWGSDDAAHLVTRALTGDATVTARVASVTGGDPNGGAKAGVILRNDLDPRGPYAMMYLSPGQGVRFQWRAAPNTGTLAATVQPESPASAWVRLERRGDRVRGLSSPDGVTWTSVGEVDLPLGPTVRTGLAVTATDIGFAGLMASAVFTDVGMTGQSSPPPFASLDLGAPAASGTASIADGVIQMTGSGDLWGRDDAAHLAYWTLTGDGAVSVRLDALSGGEPGGNAKAGVLIRAGLDPQAPYALMGSTVSGGLRFQSRAAAGDATQSVDGAPPSDFPAWLRIERVGASLTGSTSPDGTVWTEFGTATIALGDEALIGLAVTATDIDAQGLVASATFSEVLVSAGATTPVAADAPARGPASLAITTVFPNPARRQATVRLDAARPGTVTVDLLDTLGRTVGRHQTEGAAPGERSVVFDLSGFAPGVYVVRAQTDAGEVTHTRLTVVR